MADFILSYTGEEVNKRLCQIDEKANTSDLAAHINNKKNPHEVKWEQLPDKPFGDYTEVILPETTCEVIQETISEIYILITTPAISPLVAGETYTITWNGEKYVKEAIDIGDGLAVLNGNEDEPFNALAVFTTANVPNEGLPEGVYGTSYVQDSSETVTLSIVKEDLRTINPKYLPTNTTITIKRWEAND